MLDQDTNQKTFKTGDTIMKQGEPGNFAYIIEEGHVEILVEKPDGTEQSVGTRGSGTMIGEMAIIDNAPRTATVRALEECKMLEISAVDFARRLEAADPILRMSAQVILTRYRDMLARADIIGDVKSWPPPEAVELTYAEKAQAIQTIKMSNDFKAAIDNGEIYLHYQPIINLQTGEVAGFEALMRWEHPEKGFISPELFIPMAEDNGLIIEATRWALRESCSALKRLEQACDKDGELFMSVNFSSSDFSVDNFVETTHQIINDTGVKPEQLHIEITERLLMDQPETAKKRLKVCQDAGMSIAIDDFGTGYSSLSYLHYFPIDTLKIDRSFVQDMMKKESSMALIKSIVSLAKNMKMKVIAEGAETIEEARVLKELNCDLCQGYFFARPAIEKDTTQTLQNWEKSDL